MREAPFVVGANAPTETDPVLLGRLPRIGVHKVIPSRDGLKQATRASENVRSALEPSHKGIELIIRHDD